MNPSHMHHHRPSATLSLKFAETKKVKEEEESDMEEEQEEELEFEDEVETEEEEEESEEVEEVKEEEQEEEDEEVEETQLKKKRMDLDGGSGSRRPTTTAAGGSGGFGVAPPLICRVEKCNADLADSKKYHKRHRVCEYHAKAQVAMVDGRRQRFCQQCSRFHELSEFDDTKRSCRRRLEGHNARRRKNSMESRAEGSGHGRSRLAPKKDQCRQVEERGRSQIAFPKNHQNLHIH